MKIAARVEIVDLDTGQIIEDGRIFEPTDITDYGHYKEYEFRIKMVRRSDYEPTGIMD